MRKNLFFIKKNLLLISFIFAVLFISFNLVLSGTNICIVRPDPLLNPKEWARCERNLQRENLPEENRLYWDCVINNIGKECVCADNICKIWVDNNLCDWYYGITVCSEVCRGKKGEMSACEQTAALGTILADGTQIPTFTITYVGDIPPGGPCDYDNDCTTLQCENGYCNHSEVGEPCQVHEDCSFGATKCVNIDPVTGMGICQAANPVCVVRPNPITDSKEWLRCYNELERAGVRNDRLYFDCNIGKIGQECSCADNICKIWVDNNLCDWEDGIQVCKAVCRKLDVKSSCQQSATYGNTATFGTPYTGDDVSIPPYTITYVGDIPPGGPCEYNANCTTNNCTNNVCDYSGPGGPCVIHEDCSYGATKCVNIDPETGVGTCQAANPVCVVRPNPITDSKEWLRCYNELERAGVRNDRLYWDCTIDRMGQECSCADNICKVWVDNNLCDWEDGIQVCKAVCRKLDVKSSCQQSATYGNTATYGGALNETTGDSIPPYTITYVGDIPPGGPCDYNEDCTTGICNASLMCDYSGIGGSCQVHEDCSYGATKCVNIDPETGVGTCQVANPVCVVRPNPAASDWNLNQARVCEKYLDKAGVRNDRLYWDCTIDRMGQECVCADNYCKIMVDNNMCDWEHGVEVCKAVCRNKDEDEMQACQFTATFGGTATYGGILDPEFGDPIPPYTLNYFGKNPATGPCEYNEDCTTNKCVAGTCDYSGPGGPCVIHEDCSYGANACINGFCQWMTTELYVNPSSIVDTGLTPGQTFTVDINLKDVANLYGFEFKLGYDTRILDATKITIIPFLNEPTYPAVQEINDPAGYVWVSLASLYPAAPKSGSGTLARITFKVTGSGGTFLDLYNTILGDPSSHAIPHMTNGGYFTNHPPCPGDLTGDWIVNILDLIKVGVAFGSEPGDSNWDPKADVNIDFKINILDIIYLGRNYGNQC